MAGYFFVSEVNCCITTVVDGTSCEVPVGIIVAISVGVSSPGIKTEYCLIGTWEKVRGIVEFVVCNTTNLLIALAFVKVNLVYWTLVFE